MNNIEKHIDKVSRQNETSGINITKIRRLVRRYWYLYALSMAGMILIAWAFLRFQIPVYEITSNILIKENQTKQGISTADLLSKEFALNTNKKILTDETQIMTSYSVMEEVTKNLKLDRSVYLRHFLSKTELYGKDNPILIDSFSLTDNTKDFKATMRVLDTNRFQLTFDDGIKQVYNYGVPFDNTYGSFLIRKTFSQKQDKEKTFYIVCKGIENATKQTMKSIEIVLPKKESYIFAATIKSTAPQKAKDILHKMVVVYNQQSLNDNSELSQNTLNFVEKRLASLGKEMTGVEHNVESYKTKENMTPDGTSDINFLFNKLGEYDSELVKLGVQNDILSSIESVLLKDGAAFELLPTNLELKSTGLQTQIMDYNKLVLERNRLAKAAGENNPNLKIIVEDLRNIKAAIVENIGRVKQDNKTLLAQIESKNTQYTDKLNSTPRKERELLEIKRNQNIKEGLYLFLLQKQEEMGMSIVGASANARVVDKPLLGDPPATTNAPFIYLFSIFLGGLLTSLSIGFKAVSENTIQSETDISGQTGMPILAKIPFNTTNEDWVITSKSRTAVSEMFRLLRANLQFYLPKKNYENSGQVILVTSTISGEGKSFVTSNLAMSLAIADKKTVIIELDLRRPKMLDLATSDNIMDVTDYLNYNIHPSEVVHASEKHENLFFISSRPTTENPSELIMSPKMGDLLAYLREQFDYIIIDTPPVGVDIAQTGVGDAQINLRGRGAAFNTETFIIADYRNVLLPSFGTIQFGQQPIDPIDLDRIEVVKGANGALYGPGVEAGVVHFISKSPFKEQGTTVSLAGGNRNQLQGAFRHAGVSKNGKLGYKITGFYRTAKDFENDTITDRVAAARIAAYPKQIKSSIDGSVIQSDAALDYTNKALSMTGTLEYKFTPRTTLTAVGGFGKGSALFKSGQGDGFTKATRPFGQVRLQSGRFFTQAFWSQQQGKDGESWLYVSGLTAVNIINQFEGQAQYEFSALKDKLTVIAGGDYRLNTIDTKKSVNGRYEDDDDYKIYGAYAQAKYAVAPKLDIVAAGRIDRFDALKQTAISPRIGLVFKAAENHTFRATYNYSVGSPSSLQLVNDFAAANRGAFFAWLNAGSQPMSFDKQNYYSFVTSTTSNSPNLGAKVAYNAATAGLIAAGVPKALTDYLTRVTPSITGSLVGTLATQPISRGAIGLSSSSMYEVGYKGTLNNKWSITTDLYYTKRDNNLTPAQQASSLVVYPTAGADLAAIVAAAIPADSAARFGRTPAQIGAMYKSAVESLTLKNGVPSPLGLLSSDQSPTGKTLDLTYFNLEAIDYWGADLGIVYNATPEISVFANYSHLSQVYWEKAKIKNSTSTTAFSLNQPADRFRIGGDYVRAKGFLCNVAVRYASKWTGVNGTAWSGEIPAYTIVDAGLGYAFSPKMKVNVTVTNVLDSKYSVLANAPNIGRLILAKGTVSF